MAIKVRDFTDGETAVSYEDGRRCLERELQELKHNDKVELDFEGVSYVITAFLNPVIGDLILAKGANIMQKVELLNANDAILQKIKMVRDGALMMREDME